MNETPDNHLLKLTADIVAAQVTRSTTEPSEVPDIIKAVHAALAVVGRPEPAQAAHEPAVPVKKSVFDDRIVCLECGRPFRTLKRHLEVDHHLTTQEYRERFHLAHDYPLVAREYAETRSKIALKLGLGHGRSTARKGDTKRT